MWRGELGKVSEKAGQSLADPKEYGNLFPDYGPSLQAEVMLRKERTNVIPAQDYMEILVSCLVKQLFSFWVFDTICNKCSAFNIIYGKLSSIDNF